ncbi:MAG: tRNA-dihydrouridine synthase [Patescibacteria group bacterium]|nr:tRNA-dihydrouridine synthase [Patescibacteria group bacterium]
MKSFWSLGNTRDKQKLAKGKKPIAILAPMSGVTDFPFREILCEIGKPDVIFTEFVSTEMIYRRGAVSAPDKKGGVTPPLQLQFSKKQRPIVVQFFGSRPEQFEYCAKLAVKLGFDGIDINMGCPDRKVQKQGAGSELIKNPKLAAEIIRAVKKGCGGKLPVSVKTRLGYRKKDLEWIRFLLEQDLDALTIHGRTASQGYGGEADWEMIGEAVKLRNKMKLKTLIIGNGDVKDLCRGAIHCAQYGTDGFMIGRQILHNPFVFCRDERPFVSTEERIKVALKHIKLFEKFYDSKKDFSLMKKYLKAYLSGTELKKDLMEAKTIKEARKILEKKALNSKY